MNAGKLGLLTAGLMFSLTACGILGGGGPTITSFTANPPTIMSGQSSVLSWVVADSATTVSISGEGDVTGQTSLTVSPSTTTNYTLTAENADGTSTKSVTVNVESGTGSGNGPIDPGDPASAPEGTFGVSTSASGPFDNDAGEQGPINSDDDPRIISVAPGSTFYAQVDYSDPEGIASITIQLRNSSPEGLQGTLPKGGFTVGEPTDCDLSSSPTAVTCIYPITVDAGTVDIEELDGAGSEFAYVFRAFVSDSAGNSVLGQSRGYVNIE